MAVLHLGASVHRPLYCACWLTDTDDDLLQVSVISYTCAYTSTVSTLTGVNCQWVLKILIMSVSVQALTDLTLSLCFTLIRNILHRSALCSVAVI